MKIQLAIVAGAAALLALAGCGERPVEGTITHKQYSAPYDYITYHCVSYDKNGLCTFNMPVTNHMPASYQICVKGVDKNGKDAEGCWEIPPNEYTHWHEGDHYASRAR